MENKIIVKNIKLNFNKILNNILNYYLVFSMN